MATVIAKPRQIKALPDVSGHLSALLHDFSLERRETSSRLHIDLSNLRRVDAIGLSIFLAGLFLGKEHPEDYSIDLSWSNSSYVNQVLADLNISGLLDTISAGGIGRAKNLFDEGKLVNVLDEQKLCSGGNEIQEIILFRPRSHSDRQEAVNYLSRSVKNFVALDNPRTFNHEQIVKVIIELAKNTYDHSYGIGIVGLRMTRDETKTRKIQISYCDTGEGIAQNVRKFLKASEDAELGRLSAKGGAVDILHKAFTAGFTTKHGNGVNFGMGLTLISQGAAGCGFNLMLRDADSLVDLAGIDDALTHSKMRSRAVRTTAARLLLFYFEKEISSEHRAK